MFDYKNIKRLYQISYLLHSESTAKIFPYQSTYIFNQGQLSTKVSGNIFNYEKQKVSLAEK